MRTSLFALLGLAAALCVLGCERDYGFNRKATLSAYPSLECVGRVVRTMPGLSTVEAGLRDFPGEPRSGEPGSHRLLEFEGLNVSGVLTLIVEDSGEIVFSQSHVTVGTRPEQQVITETRKVMRDIERRLVDECGMTELSSVIETCFTISCPKI